VTISAVVVHYGDAPDLERCLASLEPPPGRELEVVLVEVPSEATLPAWVSERHPRVRILRLEENAGFGAAVNRGVAASRGESVLVLNNDAWLAPGCLDALAARLEREPRLAWAAPRIFYPDGRPQTVWAPDPGLWGEALQRLRAGLERGRPRHQGRLVRLLARLGGPGWYTGACALLRRAAFEEVGGFDPGFFLYFEDADLGRRLRRAGWMLALEPAAVAYHASAGAGRGGRTAVEYRRSQLRYYRKHRPRWEQAVLRRYQLAKYRWFRAPSAVNREIVGLLEDRGP
jgi:GT2 family glycosyltransferase